MKRCTKYFSLLVKNRDSVSPEIETARREVDELCPRFTWLEEALLISESDACWRVRFALGVEPREGSFRALLGRLVLGIEFLRAVDTFSFETAVGTSAFALAPLCPIDLVSLASAKTP
jgi:hypothetical protein